MAFRDYSKGKIYKIVVDTDEKYKPYVGSTVQGLAERMGGHRASYKRWKNGKEKCSSFDLFEKYGVEKCRIILLEEYPCDSKIKLLMKEREWFDKIECCNQLRPFTSKDEKKEKMKIFHDEHKEEIAEKKKEWYEANKEQIAEKKKEWYEANKEQIAGKNKEYYDKHKEQIAGKNKEKFECPCKSICRLSDKVRHERSLKHQNYLSSLKV